VLATVVISSPTAAASVVAAKLVTYVRGWFGHDTRETSLGTCSSCAGGAPTTFRSFLSRDYTPSVSLSLSLSFSLFLSLSLLLYLYIFQSLQLRRVVLFADNRAAHYDGSTIIDGEGGKRETGRGGSGLPALVAPDDDDDNDDDNDGGDGKDDDDNDEEDEDEDDDDDDDDDD
jgi:hypothetical protein